MIEHPIQPILKTLPTLPGCYMYRDLSGTILYVGKAKNLRKRVSSYFLNYNKLTARIQLMVDNAVDVEFHTVESEVEALILEASLIKKYKPKYNVLLKDDKSYSWIKITKDPYPIVYRTRNTNDRNAYYYGPFTSGIARDQIYNFLRKEFPFRTCTYNINDEELAERARRRKSGERVRSRLCTFYHIGRCGGPCEGLVSIDEYSENIDTIKKFLKNKKRVIIKDLENKMKFFSGNQEYERAAKVKEQIDSLNYVSTKAMIAHGDDEDDVMRLEFQRAQKGLEILLKRLKIADFKKMNKQQKADYLENFRIECYDISNTQGTNPVGSMVVNVGGIMLKQHYRKFKINVKETPDDFAMMREMLTRRFRYLAPNNLHNIRKVQAENIRSLDFKENSLNKMVQDPRNKKLELRSLEELTLEEQEAFDTIQTSNINLQTSINHELPRTRLNTNDSFSSNPDLVIIDGGKGQLGIANEVLHDLKLENLNVCGLAKRREEIFKPGEKVSYLFDNRKEALFLLQRIRDEAHRFGITYHRLRRSKAMIR